MKRPPPFGYRLRFRQRSYARKSGLFLFQSAHFFIAGEISGLAGQQGHYPFGESWYSASTTTKWQFTSYERDAESGNDYAMARYHISRLGRFNSPDPVSGSPADPQSWNRFAYSRNDPINLADPSGRDPWIIEAFLSGDLPFTNPYEFNLALMDAMARAHLGWRYSDLPGRYGGYADEEARYLTIITTGYDPALGIFRGDVHILADRPDGSQGGVVLTNPTLAEVNAVLVQAAIWASETSPFVFSQFPQLAAAGAGAGTVSVAVTWIGTGGAVIGSGTLLVAGGVVVGAAALGYGGYLAYRYFKIPKIIRDAAGQVGVSARALGRAVEQFKFNNNLPPNFNLDWTTIIGIAEALKRGEYYTK